jgi:hypothetical protein
MNDSTPTPLSNSSNSIFLRPTPRPRLHTPYKETIIAAVLKKRDQDVLFGNSRHAFAPRPRQIYDSPMNDSRHQETDISSKAAVASTVDENEAGDDVEDFILTVPGSAMDNSIENNVTITPFVLLPRFSRRRKNFEWTF